MELLSGDAAFEAAGPLLRVLVWTLPILCFNSVLSAALMATGAERYLALAMLVVAILNVGLNLWAIPSYGPAGAAATTVASEIVLAVLCLWFVTRTDRRATLTTSPDP